MSARVGFQWLGQQLVANYCAAPPPACVGTTRAEWDEFNDWRRRDPNFLRWRTTGEYQRIFGFDLYSPNFPTGGPYPPGSFIQRVTFDPEGTCFGFDTVGRVHYMKWVLSTVRCGHCYGGTIRLPDGSCFGCGTGQNTVPQIGADGRPHCVCPAGWYLPKGSAACAPIPACAPNSFWNGTACVPKLQAAPRRPLVTAYARPPVRAFTVPRIGTPGSVGQATVTLKQNHIYRSRTLFGFDPSKNNCDDVRDFLNASITAGQATNANWPWSKDAALRLIATLNPNSKFPVNIDQGLWPVQRIGFPFQTANACLIYMQGQWQGGNTTISATDLAKLAGPNAKLLDIWDHTDDSNGLNPLVDLTGTGCGTVDVLTFNPSTGAFECHLPPGALPPQAPSPGAFTTIPGNVYRTRWLGQVQPQDVRLDSCDKVFNVLKLFAAQLSSNTAFPYENLSVSFNPPADWESAHIGVPYTIEEGWCVFYIQGTARFATSLDPNQTGAPGVRVLDMWDSTSNVEIKAAPQPPPDCAANPTCTYHPLSDTFTFEQPVSVISPPPCPGQVALYDALRKAYVCCDVTQSIDPVTGTCAIPSTLPTTVTCPPNSHPDVTSPTGCRCDSGYQTDGIGNCVPQTAGPLPAVTCPSNSHPDATSPTGCACDSGYRTDGANCVPVTVTPPLPVAAAAAKPSNTALYVGLGALVVTALFLAGRLAS